MLDDVNQHRTKGSDDQPRHRKTSTYGFRPAAPTAAEQDLSPSNPSMVARWVSGGRAAVSTHGARAGIDGYMAGCRCSRCCAAQHARELQVSAFFARRHHT